MQTTEELSLFAPEPPVDWQERINIISKHRIRTLVVVPATFVTQHFFFTFAFPRDIRKLIFTFLSLSELNKCSTVCRLWKEEISNDADLWRQLFLRTWQTPFLFEEIKPFESILQTQLQFRERPEPIDWKYEYKNRYMWETYYYPFMIPKYVLKIP